MAQNWPPTWMIRFQQNVQEEAMFEFISVQDFCQYLFDNDKLSEKAATILQAILEARSPRLSDLSHKMPASSDANYKMLQRFMVHADPKVALQRLFWEEAPFILGDPTEMPRPHAENTDYVGWLKDGKTRGFWLLLLAVPFRGRAIPFHFVTYSSQTIQQKANSRNLEHKRAFQEVKMLLGEKPLVLDREFSYLTLLEALEQEGLKFIIRLNLGSHPPELLDDEGRQVKLALKPGGRKVYQKLYYKGKVCVNIAGEWQKGLKDPLWVMTNLDAEEGLGIYQERMKIEEAFKDLKSLLCIDKLMNKRQEYMEKMIAMVLIAYCIGLLVGEAIRDYLYRRGSENQKTKKCKKGSRGNRISSKWKLYSGLFILLKHKLQLPLEVLEEIVKMVFQFFVTLVHGNVRSFV
jgi:hypothetical protein